MVWESDIEKENNKMTNFILKKHVAKLINAQLLKNYLYFFNVNDYLYFSYFYWIYEFEYVFSMEGLCIKWKTGNSNIFSFILHDDSHGVKLNQLFFLNNPSIVFLKKKHARIKKRKVIYIL